MPRETILGNLPKVGKLYSWDIHDQFSSFWTCICALTGIINRPLSCSALAPSWYGRNHYYSYCPLSNLLQAFSMHSETIGRKNKKLQCFLLLWHIHSSHMDIDGDRSLIWKSLDLNSSQTEKNLKRNGSMEGLQQMLMLTYNSPSIVHLTWQPSCASWLGDEGPWTWSFLPAVSLQLDECSKRYWQKFRCSFIII